MIDVALIICLFFLLLLLCYVLKCFIFRIFNSAAYAEYKKVLRDLDNNKIPYDDSGLTEYKQSLRYVSIKQNITVLVSNKREIITTYAVTTPYENYIKAKKNSAEQTITIFNWAG